MNELREHIQKLIDENDVIIFMKGTPDAPACGFSARAAGILDALGKPYAAVDILPDARIREQLSEISQWPTIPQLFVDHELVGGSDIMIEMYESGELAEALGVTQDEAAPAAEQQPAVKQPAGGIQLENNLE